MTSIYEQHDHAFANVSAFVILKDGARVATVALKFPKDGAGRLWAYVHVIGLQMVRGCATGYGYDKRSAAVEAAFAKVEASDRTHADLHQVVADAEKLKAALSTRDGYDWGRRIEEAGFTLIQAV